MVPTKSGFPILLENRSSKYKWNSSIIAATELMEWTSQLGTHPITSVEEHFLHWVGWIIGGCGERVSSSWRHHQVMVQA
jgi:hypothetical protein